MGVSKRKFGVLNDGREVYCWSVENEEGIKVEILDYGATIRTIIVPDRNGNATDVVLGYDTIEEYVSNSGCFGAAIGRFANRIRAGKFTLNGKEYTVAVNNGPNHLHGGIIGYNRMIWDVKDENGALVCYLTSPDGDEGYPGKLDVKITYSLNGTALEIHYEAVCDKDTITNLTNHSYFNLNGKGNVNDQYLLINADEFTPNDLNCLPTGEILSVKGTCMDFLDFHKIGERADCDEEYVKPYKGYDGNLNLNGNKPSCIAFSDESGIKMTVETTEPGVQLYTGNKIGERNGKNGVKYGIRSGFCLETQHYPDCINHPEWPSCVLKAGEKFDSTTVYAFSLKD